jgi:Domain of unknown function (DUF5667)
MIMKIEREIDQIIERYLPSLSCGEETIDSVLAKHADIRADLRPRLEAAMWLHQVRRSVEPRPGYISSSRKYLVERISSMQPAGLWQRIFRRYSPQRWVFNIAAPVIVLLLLALVINSAVLTARLSIPGEPLYSTKLVLEATRLALTFDPLERTDLHIHYSRERTTEFVELVLEGDYDDLPVAARRLETQINTSLRSLNAIPQDSLVEQHSMTTGFKDTLSSEVLMLNVLKTTSPPSAHAGIQLAINAAQIGMLALR